MANPVTHILVPLFIVEIYRRCFAKKPFSKWYVFLAGLFGAAPDFDFFISLLLTRTFDDSYHRIFTHTLIIPIVLLVAGFLIYMLWSKKVLRYEGWKVSYLIMFMACIGVTAHVLLDGVDGLVQWFYPFGWSVNLPNLILNKYRAGILDGALILAWLLYDKTLSNDILRFLRIKR